MVIRFLAIFPEFCFPPRQTVYFVSKYSPGKSISSLKKKISGRQRSICTVKITTPKSTFSILQAKNG